MRLPPSMLKPFATRPVTGETPRAVASDVLIFAAGLALFSGVLILARTWLGPFQPQAPISRDLGALPLDAAYSTLRIAIAFVASLIFALFYGYFAAYYPKAERWLIPILDIMQSIPVLSFLPGVMLAMIAIFPKSQIGVEIGAILLIFTGQVWNIAFSFYSSLKSIPRELMEAARIYGFGTWQRLLQLELPYAAIGLVWNSMVSVATGWFFLMACEMFVLGKRDFRLQGLGSYLQTAASAGDTKAILWGMAAMVTIIVLTDQLVWRPVIAWADKFKLEQVETDTPPSSPVLTLLQRSAAIGWIGAHLVKPLSNRLIVSFARRRQARAGVLRARVPLGTGVGYVLLVLAFAAAAYAAYRVGHLVMGLHASALMELLRSAGATFLRIMIALVIGAAWTIPVGVAIGSSPRLARIAQPLAQIAASVPATALFPVVLLFLIGRGGMNVAAIVFMLLGTQWYILFNVIAGAIGLPGDLKEAARVFRFRRIERWRKLILPGIFPYLVTGFVTAAGGAWNASILAEYTHFKGQILQTEGLGSLISRAADGGDFDQLLLATAVLAAIVVVTNRLLWKRLYRLAETRYRLET
jgi:NitT/TauT family transport system permease protein